MPHTPKHPCSFPGCPALTDDRYCPRHQSVIDARYNHNERDPHTKRRYGGGWQRIRARQLAEQPLCEACRRKGRLTPAREVHHIIPLTAGGTHEQANLMSLCKPCHSRITLAESRQRPSREGDVRYLGQTGSGTLSACYTKNRAFKKGI